ncbi:hypothetical protein ABZV67_21970 [Streptomyces sp. NPDC005065]
MTGNAAPPAQRDGPCALGARHQALTRLVGGKPPVLGDDLT